MMSSYEEMSLFEKSRWFALLEAIDIIDEQCLERNKDFESLNLEPLALKKYIENMCDRHAKIIEREEEKEKKRLKFLSHIKHVYIKEKDLIVQT